MNQFSRNSLLAQRLLGMRHALKSSGPGTADNAAALPLSLTSFLQHMQFSSEAGGDGSSATGTEPEAPPKKRRGRPPKVKPTESATTEETTTLTASSSSPTENSTMPKATSSVASIQHEAKIESSLTPSKPRLPRIKPKPLLQGLSTVINPVSIRDPSNWHSGASVADLNPSNTSSPPAPFGFYIDIPSTALPEAEATFYHDPALTEERVKQPHYGCKAATAEFEFSGKRVVLHRPVISTLLEKALSVAASDQSGTGSSKKIYVEGWTGAGKSMALYTLAATARAAGKVVLYLPAASLLTQGGRFYRREAEIESEDEKEESTTKNSTSTVWDTPEAARHILTAVMNAHSDQLATMPALNNNNKTLAEVVTAGLASTDPTEIVEAAVTLKDGILAHENGMVIVDEYNALYSHTGYHEPMHQFYRRPLAVDELRLAKSFRILDGEEESRNSADGYKGVAVVAPSYGGSISPTLRILQASRTSKNSEQISKIDVIRVPRFDVNEVSAFAAMSVGTGGLPSMPGEVELRRALALTNGNAKELRELQSTLLLAEGPLGPSLGYKAFAVARKEYNVALEM